MRSGVHYLAAAVLLLIGGLPLLAYVSEPNRFLAGQHSPEPDAALLAQELKRLRGRVGELETQLAALRTNNVLALDAHVELIPQEQAAATLRFSGVNLQVVNHQGVALDTAAGR